MTGPAGCEREEYMMLRKLRGTLIMGMFFAGLMEVEGIFSDLKRHDLGPKFHERQYDALSVARGSWRSHGRAPGRRQPLQPRSEV